MTNMHPCVSMEYVCQQYKEPGIHSMQSETLHVVPIEEYLETMPFPGCRH